MSWPPAMKLVLVEWIDSNSAGGWHPYEDMLHTVQGELGCKSVGWLLADGHDRISIVPNLAATGSVGDATTIPKLAIVSITELSVP